MPDESPNSTGSTAFWRLRRAVKPTNHQAADESADSVGLYLSGNQAFLAHVRSSGNRLPVVVQHLAATLDPRPAVATGQLRSHLLAVGNGRIPKRLWTCIQSPGMVLQALRIPRVRPPAMASAAFWTLKKERNLHTEDTVFDIELLRPVLEDGAPQFELLAVAVPKDELDDHQQFNAELGTRAVGVTPSVFAFRNFLRLGYPDLSRRPCAVLFINDASSDVFVFDAGQVLAVRTLRTGLDSLRDAIVQTLDIDSADPRVAACLALLADEQPDPAVFGSEPPPSVEDVFGWGRPVARRLARNIQRTLHAFEGTIDTAGGAGPVFLVAGTITRYERLVRFLGDQIGIELIPFTPAHSEFLRQLQPPDTPEPPEASGMSLAIGLALADSYHTPNLLFTFEDRRRLQQRSTVLRGLRVAVTILLVALIASTAALHHYLRMRERVRDRLRETVTIGTRDFDKKSIMVTSEQAMARQAAMMGLAEAYFAPAVVAEVASLTPPTIFLLEIRADFTVPSPAAGDAKAKPGAASEAQTLLLQGVIPGTRELTDALFAEYLFRIQRSPFFQSPELLLRRLESVDPNYLAFGDKTADHLLFFTLRAKLRDQRPKPPEEKPQK